MNRPILVLLAVLATAGVASSETIAVGDLEVTVSVEAHAPSSDRWTWVVDERASGLSELTVRFAAQEPAVPPPLKLEWSMPSRDIRGQWTSRSNLDKALDPDWMPTTVQAALARHAPVMTLFGTGDRNISTVAISDALNTSRLSCAVREENARIYCGAELLAEPHRAVTGYEAVLRFDRRGVPLHVALAGVADWWAEQPGYEPAAVPPAAREPVYSSWYSYHQKVSETELLREAELAAALGMKTIIVDDGWQTLDSRRGYAYTGDWRPERLPGLAELVSATHDLGVRFVLWYAVPFAGEQSDALAEFDGKFLRYWDGQGAYVLDPRYPEVRKRIIDTYTSAIEDWDLDGFKLDFIARFVADEETELTLADGRDFASVNEATDRLLTDLMTSAQALRPDVMIEFRQPYIGPLMRKYGNMFRAGDVPNAYVANRVRTVDLRLLSGETAVHSDMLMWHPDEPVEQAASQLLNVMFSVPQVSVRLDAIPPAHTEMLTFYLDYWSRNRPVLLDGELVPTDAMANYPRVAAHGASKTIVALYQDLVATIDPARASAQLDVINANPSPRVIVEVEGTGLGEYGYTVRDCTGRTIRDGEVTLSSGLHEFAVPVSGILQLVRRPAQDR